MPVFPDGSLGTLGEGSMAFGSNSGSMLADGVSLIAGMGIAMISGLFDAMAANVVASVA